MYQQTLGTFLSIFRFVVLRRHEHDHLSTHHMVRHAYPSNQHTHMNNNGVWSTAYLPPSYDNIYQTSVPVNIGLPDYESALSMNNKQFVHKQNSNEPVVFRSNLNEQPNQPTESSFITFNNISTVTNPLFNSNTNQNSNTSNNLQPPLESDDANSSNSTPKMSK